MTAVSVESVAKRFGANEVLSGVDLEVARGEVVALLGPSGCGKTTLLRVVAGLEEPDAGAVRLDGETVAGGGGPSVPPERRRLGMVFQSYAVWPHLDVAANVAYPLRMAGVPTSERARRVEAALALVSLSGLGGRLPHQLSGGQQQRVALARALVAEPRVLLLDEPFSNLDARLREETREELRALVRRLGITALLVTHDQEEAFVVADRVALMARGRVEQVGSPEDLYHRPATAFVARFVGSLSELPARAEGPAGERLSVRVGSRPALLARPLAGCPTAGEVLLAFRPEAARLVDPEGAPLAGVVESRWFAGRHHRHRLRVAGTPVVVDHPEPVAPGAAVGIDLRDAFACAPGPPGMSENDLT